MEHYQSACYGLAWRLLGNPDQAADAVQDAFIHAYTAIDRYPRRDLPQLAAADHGQRELRHPAPRAAAAPRRPCRIPRRASGSCRTPHAPNPVAEAARSEMYRYLEAALRLLPEDQRIAIVLCDVYGMDYNDVAPRRPPRSAR